MSSKSKLKVEKLGVLAVSIFYVIAGGLEVALLAVSNFRLVFVGFLAVLSLVTAYGVIRMRKWSVFLALVLFFPAVAFGTSTLYASINVWRSFYPSADVLLFHLVLIAYLFMMLISLVYVLAVREGFK